VPSLNTGISTADLIATRAQLLLKREQDLANFQSDVLKSQLDTLRRFEDTFACTIIDFDFEPGRLVLLRNSKTKESLNRKTKPRYLGPYVGVKRTKGGSYILAELDGSVSRLRTAAFRVIPYLSHSTSSVPVTKLVDVPIDELESLTQDDPSNTDFEASNSFATSSSEVAEL